MLIKEIDSETVLPRCLSEEQGLSRDMAETVRMVIMLLSRFMAAMKVAWRFVSRHTQTVSAKIKKRADVRR